MNLPYTMDHQAKAAHAVREFKPKIVYPYHYRNADKSMADLEEFKKLVGTDSGVEVRLPSGTERERKERRKEETLPHLVHPSSLSLAFSFISHPAV